MISARRSKRWGRRRAEDSALRRASVTHSYRADNPCSLRDKGAGGKNRFQPPYMEGFMPKQAKTVFVRNYTRIRFGHLEHVCSHWRSAPGQLSFNFD
ncbi:hypothetical protein DF147_22140 [Burkholderia cenocepacia]|nr:hypothetical protein DF147_22140 [Burkholderia cenocepacia]RQV90587.1 hypothetical protein DF019_05570 [Burkholderia cenocepacia]